MLDREVLLLCEGPRGARNLQAGLWRYWAVTDKGIYFATAEVASNPVIEFFSFATSKISLIVRLDTPLFRTDPGLAVTPDGQSLLLLKMDQRGSDIMLAENFRQRVEPLLSPNK